MRKVFLATCCVSVLLLIGSVIGCSDDDPAAPTPVNQSGSIGVYADAAGTDLEVTDTGGIVMLYVVHHATRAAAVSFRVDVPAGWTHVGNTNQFAVSVGTIADGMSIAYGSCQEGTIHALTMAFDSPGNSPPGDYFRVRPHTQSTSIEVLDCNSTTHRDAVGLESPVVTP